MTAGTAEWYEARTALFAGMCDDIWNRAETASKVFIVDRKSKHKTFNRAINRCQEKHPFYTQDQIRQAFECARDDVLGKIGGDELDG